MTYKNEIRIIGGHLRGRKIKVPISADLRPTPDRVRETLFNWLGHAVEGANCLDLFAGSGALGFEALSRGASSVTFVDSSAVAMAQIKETAKYFGREVTERSHYICASIPPLPAMSAPFNIVFLDPPYLAYDLLLTVSKLLEFTQCLASDAIIYLEANKVIADNELPSHWHIKKQKQAGQVYYYLIQRMAHESD